MPHCFYPNADGGYSKNTQYFFDWAQMQLIMVGHKPHGDMPSPVSVKSSMWALCCDTSYLGDTIWYDHKNITAKQPHIQQQQTNLGQGNAV
jgi:hypothetical protein